MDKEFEMKILEVIVERRESSYLGIYVMSCFASFDKEIQKILELIELLYSICDIDENNTESYRDDRQ